jgi:hypothetical protein
LWAGDDSPAFFRKGGLDMDHQYSSAQRKNSQNEKGSTKLSEIGRLAKLVATGQVPFPTELGSQERTELVSRVAELRREMLLSHIAQAIAMDIHRSDEPV